MTDSQLSFARVALGELAIGIDTRFVVRALARPRTLARLPRSHGAIDGVFADGGQAIPVVDLRKWMGEAAPDGTQDAPAQVLVLGTEGRLVGLAIDAVQGLVRARASELRRIHHEQAEDDFFHSVAPDGGGGLLSLLDPQQLMACVRAWTSAEGEGAQDRSAQDRGAQDSGAHAGSDAGADGDGKAPPQALVRIGASLVALPAALVAQVLARPAAEPVLGAGGALLGTVRWRGRHLPMVDLASLLALEAGAAPLAAVLADGERMLALPIDEVVAVRPLPAARMVAARDAGLELPVLRALTLQEDGQRVLVVDAEALLDAHAAPGLSRQAPAGDGTAGSGKADAVRRAGAHVVFDAGRRWAIPMAALEEILPLADGADALPTFTWRGRSLPLLDLCEPGRDGVAPAGKRAIVVRHEGRHAALRVHDVVELLPAQAGELLRFQAAGGKRVSMIVSGAGSARISYPVLEPGELPFFAAA